MATLSTRITESILAVILVTSRCANQSLSLSLTVNTAISVKFDSCELRWKWAPEILMTPPELVHLWRYSVAATTWSNCTVTLAVLWRYSNKSYHVLKCVITSGSYWRMKNFATEEGWKILRIWKNKTQCWRSPLG